LVKEVLKTDSQQSSASTNKSVNFLSDSSTLSSGNNNSIAANSYTASNEIVNTNNQNMPRRSSRERKPPDRYGEWMMRLSIDDHSMNEGFV